MNERQAIAKLHKLLGKRAAYRIDDKAPDAETRAAYRAALPDLRADEKEAREALDARRAEVLAADPVYQSLLCRWRTVKQTTDNAASIGYRSRITAGVDMGIGLSVKAEGDNWQEVIDKLESATVAA
jgi:hypothetical protein